MSSKHSTKVMVILTGVSSLCLVLSMRTRYIHSACVLFLYAVCVLADNRLSSSWMYRCAMLQTVFNSDCTTSTAKTSKTLTKLFLYYNSLKKTLKFLKFQTDLYCWIKKNYKLLSVSHVHDNVHNDCMFCHFSETRTSNVLDIHSLLAKW